MSTSHISIHAAQEGCDRLYRHNVGMSIEFQSTQPKRAATYTELHRLCKVIFQSTQPKRAATFIDNNKNGIDDNFNPRSPRGLRHVFLIFVSSIHFISIHAAQEGCDNVKIIKMFCNKRFQSTQPKRAATRTNSTVDTVEAISIHAAQVGCDCLKITMVISLIIFQSTQPEWAATLVLLTTSKE